VEGSDEPGFSLASLCSWAEFLAGAWVVSSLSTLGALAKGGTSCDKVVISPIKTYNWLP